MALDMNADPYEFSERYDAGLRAAADERAAGNFAPYYVRRIGSWGMYPAQRLFFGRWGVFYDDGSLGMRDLNNCAPDFCRLGLFWRFSKACRVANALSMAFQDGQKSKPLEK